MTTALVAYYAFPYLRLKNDVTAGPWSLTTVTRKTLAATKNNAATHLQAFLARNLAPNDRPLKTATVIRYNGSSTESEAEREALLAAVGLAVADSNTRNGNGIPWDASGLDIATAEVAHFVAAQIPSHRKASWAHLRGGTLNSKTVTGRSIFDKDLRMLPPEGLVSIPTLDLDAELMDAAFNTVLAARLDPELAVHNQVLSAIHWHSRARENSPLHTMPDILVQLKTAIEALSGSSSTGAAIMKIDEIYLALDGTFGESNFLWRNGTPSHPRKFKEKITLYSDFGDWYWNLANVRNSIVHDTMSPEMDYVSADSPFAGNIYQTAERVTRELIKIRLAQLGHPRVALDVTQRKALDHAKSLGRDHEIKLIADLPGSHTKSGAIATKT